MTLSSLLIAALCLLFGIACSDDDVGGDSRQPRTNVILITLDTVRADHLSCYGYTRETSPNLDRFAAESTWYKKARTTAPWTLPAHASLFTGLYPSEHGTQMILPSLELVKKQQVAQALSLDTGFTTLAEVMTDLGYQTAGIVANFLYLGTPFNLHRGFAHYEVLPGVPGRRADWAETVNERTLAWLRDRNDGPFFLFINYMDAHTPYNTTPRPGFLKNVPPYSRRLEKKLNEIVLSEEDPVPKTLIRRFMRQYDLALANLDDGIGELLDNLRELDLYDESLVIIASDHGEYFGEHRLIEHSKDVYEPAMWIPLFVKYPEQTTGVIEEQGISLVHLPRLILRSIGLEQRVDPGLFPYTWPDPVLLGENRWALWKDLLMPWGGRFIRIRKVMYKGPFKYIESTDGKHELYNLAKDPLETRNLIRKPSPLKDRWARLLRAHWPDSQYDASARFPEEMTEEEVKRAEALGYIWSTPQKGENVEGR